MPGVAEALAVRGALGIPGALDGAVPAAVVTAGRVTPDGAVTGPFAPHAAVVAPTASTAAPASAR
ncbi:hypothetical protein [Tsukamurella columbiensis]|uniref:Uncharacterized protein n=1 Tax=Tsukamurella columbiensis TaxID=128509 RepID=A0ABX1LM07_9ACTN|nr:hypothetical protein [Tsukamurella columbiensis]NMD58280.1 hypothetical protein [Tsukamurella columbiensis]